MPREKRVITFSYTEAYQAIYSLCAQKNIKQPEQGVVQNISPMEDDPFRIAMELKCSDTGNLKREEYSRDFFAAALMLFCKGNGIPLPKTASKAISFTGGEVQLRVTI